MFYYNRFRWALRKIFIPIKSTDLVLDVGAGGNPYPRSDILLDRLTGDEHRCGDSMMIDRHVVFGDAQNMPFKYQAFDFVIASHILEHMPHPEVFIKELQRVSKAGYIETPNVVFERFHPFKIHCLEVFLKNGVLQIYKKQQAIEDGFLANLEMLNDVSDWGKLMFKHPEMFHVRYFWNKEIDFTVLNPEVSCEWIENINDNSDKGDIKDSYLDAKTGWRAVGLNLLNKWYRYNRDKRLKNFDITSILACPACKSHLESGDGHFTCKTCDKKYPVINNIPDFTVG